jgi:glycosyltransferase involved in cell wall biosynthesis
LRPAWQNRFYRRLERAYLKSVDGFIFNSRTTQATVEALAGPGRPAVVAYPAADHLVPRIDKNEIVRRAREPGPVRLLFVGNLIPRKGLHTLLSALSRLPEKVFSLEVIGSLSVDKGYVAAVRRQIAKLGLELSVRLHGALDGAALKEEYRHAQVLALPSSYEGFGLVFLESMGFGLPVVATTAGATGEIVDDGQTGFLIHPEDPEALADRLSQFLADRELLVRMSLAARQRYRLFPTWEKTGEKIRYYLRTMT